MDWKGIPSFEWQGFEWISHPLWGIVHPTVNTGDWYDENTVYVNRKGTMVLRTDLNPKEFTIDDKKEVRKWGRSYVRCTQEFKYGTFEWEMKLPIGKHQWPALWLSSDHSWPPEIDCMEGWSHDSVNYVKRLLFKDIHCTCHWGTELDHKSEESKNLLRCVIKGGSRYDKYKTVWTPDYIDVYYNGIRVKRFKDPELLKQLNDPAVKMHPIMSCGPDVGFTDEDYREYQSAGRWDVPSPELTNHMCVRSFKYTPLTHPKHAR